MTEATVIPISAKDDFRYGEFVNAARIIQDGNDEFFLDLIIHSASQKSAELLFRARGTTNFLKMLHTVIGNVLERVESKDPILMKDGLATTPDGSILVLNPHQEDDA